MDSTILASLSPEEIAFLWEGPALEPPPGIMPDFVNPGGIHGLAYGVVILGGTLAAVSVMLRVISRVVLREAFIEDGEPHSTSGVSPVTLC